MNEKQLDLYAYAVLPERLAIVPGSLDREWMDRTRERFSYRCLPLRIANQLGWFILNDTEFTAIWNGGDSPQSIDISTRQGICPKHITSHFGYGIITWNIPYLFRTPIGYNLYVRGPANMCKDGIQALDGVVESDWAVATFTMNWKFTRVGLPVSFEKDEPIAMIFPMQRGFVESFQLIIDSIDSIPETKLEHEAWSDSRDAFLRTYNSSEKKSMTWEKDYFLGRTPAGHQFEHHQIAVQLRPILELATESRDEVAPVAVEKPNSRIAGVGFRRLLTRLGRRLKTKPR